MRLLIANLRPFYQCRRLWVVYFLWGYLLYSHHQLLRWDGDTSSVLMIWAFPAGWLVAAMQENLAVKLFSFCLPGHRDVARRLIFLVCLIISTIGGLYFALYFRRSDTSSEALVLIGFLGLCFTWSTYLISIALTLAIGSGMVMSLNVFVLLFAADRHLDHVIMSHPFSAISLGILTTTIVWQWSGRPRWFRRRCSNPHVVVLFGSARSSEQAECQMADSSRFPEFPRTLDRWLLGMIRSARCPMPIKGIADTAYTTVLPLSLLPLGRPVFTLFGILFLLGLLALAGYEPEFGLILAFLLSTIAANGLTEDSPLFSKTLVQGGRRERFYVTTVRVVVQAALSGLVLLLPILMLNLLMPWLPDVNVFGSSHTFHRVPLGLAMLSMIVFPVVGLLAFCLHGRRSEVIVGVLVVAVQILVIVHLDDVPMVPTPMLVLIGVLAWFAFVLCIHRIALRGDLVRR